MEQLLRATQDDLLLKLSVNSHTTRAAAINPDLDRRFQALKKPQNPTELQNSHPPKKDNKVGGTVADGDDLFARFAALKNSIPSHTRKEESTDQQVTEEEDEDEVEKVIKWAIDAARLDPSPPSDDDDDSEDDDHEIDGGKNKSKRK